uniref:SWIM-type domain-containing protein n=1 Tax=Brassica oleracea var. oleracea TaxID=109376 RepID=A0A0D3E6P7_BRAOL
MVDLVRRTCSCGKFDLMKIPCRHAIKAAFNVGIQAHTLTDDMYTTASWSSIYEESINPISVPEDAWIVPSHVQQAKDLPLETRRAAGRIKKRRYETVEDKIRSSQGTQSSKRRKCSRCGIEGHNRSTCDR